MYVRRTTYVVRRKYGGTSDVHCLRCLATVVVYIVRGYVVRHDVPFVYLSNSCYCLRCIATVADYFVYNGRMEVRHVVPLFTLTAVVIVYVA